MRFSSFIVLALACVAQTLVAASPLPADGSAAIASNSPILNVDAPAVAPVFMASVSTAGVAGPTPANACCRHVFQWCIYYEC
ncbi:hypothetical protein FB451DRAFT_1243767 [Mycena latifolia]|nr:hypothetical protein FB451DRAFT_1243767 [Mycena latifolia]